jgi:hypothetical protein
VSAVTKSLSRNEAIIARSGVDPFLALLAVDLAEVGGRLIPPPYRGPTPTS